MNTARRFTVHGTVQGVGFRPFVARLAEAHHLSGWVLNTKNGIEIHVEGRSVSVDAFARDLRTEAPPGARIEGIRAVTVVPEGLEAFRIRPSDATGAPTLRISPDLPVCTECLEEMSNPDARRYEYPYINCTNCGPRFSIILALPYDRERTTMAAWPLCTACQAEYRDHRDRRFHAEPVACPQCGPRYRLAPPDLRDTQTDWSAVAAAARLILEGSIVAIKGVGGYHLCCDAGNPGAVAALRTRKYRKSRPFAVMVKDLDVARAVVELDVPAEELLTSTARPIVLAPALVNLPGVAPDHRELGVMLPYAPVHHLLFAAGAPDVIVMTSGNYASEPIAFEDADALGRLDGIADAYLVGERPIARRVDDSVARSCSDGPVMLRRGRGYAPARVARLPGATPVLAVGADLKNTITLLIDGDAVMSQHIGDLKHVSALEAFRETIRDFIAMYEVNPEHVILAHDLHPHYASTCWAMERPANGRVPVQHHRAHVASVLAERGALETRVVGVAFDGTGYGDDGTIWGGEFFVGSVIEGFSRAASLRPFALPGGDACARYPVQAAAGLLLEAEDPPDLTSAPFLFPPRYGHARRLALSGVRTFTSTSAGRLFDAAAALLGFIQAVEYEGQAAVWLEQLAWRSPACESLPFDTSDLQVDFRPTLDALMRRRSEGSDAPVLARAFHEAVSGAIAEMACRLCDLHGLDTVVLSGGTFQNRLLGEGLRTRIPPSMRLWMNREVPPNDGGISLGQAAMAAVAQQ
jgi:hydrogenase maturation protein HypF